MKLRVIALLVIVGVFLFLFRGFFTPFLPSSPQHVNGSVSNITLPDGFRITYFAEDVPGARSLEMVNGTLFVGTRDEGKVYAVVDEDGNFKADKVEVVASDLYMPNGVAFKNGSLYVAEVHRVLKFENILDRLDDPPSPVVVRDDFPSESHHGWKFIKFGPRGDLWVPVGAPCNVCNPPRPFASITRMNSDGSNFEVYAEGVRMSVGFDWNPSTGDLWFTDNGRDWLGDNRPPDELNHAPRKGLHFGFPFCHGKDVVDPEFSGSCSGYTKPELELGPHVAALGMRFYEGEQFPERYEGGIFIAEHGSWNRDVPIGYRVMFVEMEDDDPVGKEVFAKGWLEEDGSSWGRPVDVEVLNDGSLLVSDDKSGSVYRISYQG